MPRASGPTGDKRNTSGLLAAIGVGLVVIGLLLWWLMFRDTSAASVDSTEAAEARAAAIEQAEADSVAENTDLYSNSDSADATGAQDAPEPDQADAIAGDQGGLDGMWMVDTTIGSFGEACLDIVCDAGFVGFRINEELAGVGAKTVVGRTPAVSGTMQITGTQITSVNIVADMTQMVTDDQGRTAAIKGVTGGLETQRFPEASFVLTEPIELGELPVEGAAVTADAAGDLTVHGVTRPMTIPVVAEHQAGLIVVFMEPFEVMLADFEIPKPTSVVVLSVEEVAQMEFQLFFSR